MMLSLSFPNDFYHFPPQDIYLYRHLIFSTDCKLQVITMYPNSIYFIYLPLHLISGCLVVRLTIVIVRAVGFFSLFFRDYHHCHNLEKISIKSWSICMPHLCLHPHFCIDYYFSPKMSCLYQMAVIMNHWNGTDKLSLWFCLPINDSRKNSQISTRYQGGEASVVVFSFL